MIGGSLISSLLGTQYTIGELMQIDAGRQARAKSCKVDLIKVYHELKKESLLDKFKSLYSGPSINVYYLIFKFQVISDTGNKHIVFIRVSPDFSLQDWKNNKVKIYCDCSDFKYRSVYTLNNRGSLFRTPSINKSIGQAVSEKPKKVGTTLLCKHAFSALSWLMSNYAKVMKTV